MIFTRFYKNKKLPSLEFWQRAINYFRNNPSWDKQNGRFIPQLVNFLRGERWKEAEEALQERSAPVPAPVQAIKVESFEEKNLKLQKEQEETKKEQEKIEEKQKVFQELVKFFKFQKAIDKAYSYHLFTDLYNNGKIPKVTEKQEISLLDFLKNLRGVNE